MATAVLSQTPCASVVPAAPATRASWCGQLKLGTLCVPVKAYAAIATPPDTPLRQLHATCGKRIEYRKCCPQHGAVAPEEIVKGYPYQPDQYVYLSEEELASLQPEDEKTIELKHFLDPAQLDLALLAGRTLALLPANPAAQRPFFTIVEALRQSGKWAIGQVVFSGKRQVLAVRVAEESLLVYTLFHPALRRALVTVDASDVQIGKQEVRTLLRTINSSSEEIPWLDYQDDSERQLTQLVETKVAAGQSRAATRRNGKRRTQRATVKLAKAAKSTAARRQRKAA